MSDAPLSDRQIKLLAVVAEGGGDWDARRIDLTANSRYGPGEGTVLQELEELQRLGLAVRDDSRPGAGGRWRVADRGRISTAAGRRGPSSGSAGDSVQGAGSC
jgi:hypothetical protein